jgi:hypothetical protein
VGLPQGWFEVMPMTGRNAADLKFSGFLLLVWLKANIGA